MNPLAALITMMVALKNDLYTRFNAALKALPPMEQIEAGSAGLSIVREMEWAKQRIEQVGTDLEATLTSAGKMIAGYSRDASQSVDVAASHLIEALNANTAASAISAAIAAKTHLPIEDHQTALDHAVTQAKTEAEEAAKIGFNAEVLNLKLVADRRSEAIAKVGVLAAASLKDTDLLAANYADLLAVVEGRVAKLVEVGLTAESRPKTYGSLMACPADEAGTAEFDARLEMITENAPNGSLLASTPAVPHPTTQAGLLPASDKTPAKPVV